MSMQFVQSGYSQATNAIITSDGVALAANANRVGFSIQVGNTTPVKVKYGEGAAADDFNYILAAGTGTDTGDGASRFEIGGAVYTGIISVFTGAATRVIVSEYIE